MPSTPPFHMYHLTEFKLAAWFRQLTEDERYDLFKEVIRKCHNETDLASVELHIVKKICVNLNVLQKQLKAIELDYDVTVEELLLLLHQGIISIYPEFDLSIIAQAMNATSLEDCETILQYSLSNKVIERYLTEVHNLEFEDDPLLSEDELDDWIKRIEEGLIGIDLDLDDDLEPALKKRAKKTTKKPSTKFKKPEDLLKALKKVIKGQDEALGKIVNKVLPLLVGLRGFTSVFLIGPTGVGKTELAKTLSNVLFGKGKLIVVDCAQLGNKHESAKLLGAPPGYIGFDDQPLLTKYAKESNEYVFLFDEFEKSHRDFQDSLLRLLDTGELMDNKGDMLDFKKSIFLFTSNLGTDKVLKDSVGFNNSNKQTIEDIENQFTHYVKKYLNPEFTNRLREIVVFNKLNESTIKVILKDKLKALPINFNDNRNQNLKILTDYLLGKIDYKYYGARDVEKKIEQYIEPILASKLLSISEERRKTIKFNVRLTNGEISFVQAR